MFGGHEDTVAQPAQDTAAPAAAPVGTTLPAPADDTAGVAPAGAPPLTDYDPEGLNQGAGVAASVVTPTVAAAPAAPVAAGDDLLQIKQQALQQLTPLVGHLDQTPEEKFRTTMMMIQASDNQALVKEAYEAAQSIADEKVRAQALLDIVNEINYFTQQQEPQQ
jgi:hypothetical protein